MTTPEVSRFATSPGRYLGRPRFDGYLRHCGGDAAAALVFYQWNVEASGAMWETIGYVEVALRNCIAGRLAERHRHKRRSGSWLDDPAAELDQRARDDIDVARQRLQRKRKPISDGQIIAELGFGFWRFLLANRYATTLWPGIAGGFPYSPDRNRATVTRSVVRLHDFRNRLAHHERIWNQPVAGLHNDALTILRFITPDLAHWVAQQSRVPHLLATCPQHRPHP